MVRVKRGKTKRKKRKKVLKLTKGFRWGRKSKYRLAKEALLHAFSYAFRDRKEKKRAMRRLWQQQIGAACKEHNLSYSKFLHKLKLAKIELDRKILAHFASKEPQIFSKILEKIKEKEP